MELRAVNADSTMPLTGDVRELVRAEMERGGMSQAQVAREAGINSARLSQWLADKYQGDNATVDAAMRTWLKARSERASGDARLPGAPGWIPTATAKRVQAALFYAQMAGDIAVTYGGAGVGKTCTAMQYQRENPNVWIATMTPATSSLATCLERIALSVGIREVPQGALRIESAITSRIQGTGGLLIVDEAQHLSKAALEGVRSIHDLTQVGLALLGNESVYAQLTGGSRQAHFAQLFSRIGRRLRLNTPDKEDVEALLDAWSVPGDARESCRQVARQNGALRGLTKMLRVASMMAAGEGHALSNEHVRAAWCDLGGKA
ncbi:AAA family ATPase [Solidesulfovibrio sp.]|uniref:AAA family ATPase n=1 Tax=Solidesulfovibrio sp. TaxID=2910990 RepID=UPI002B211427|nr:AAA family ATPase [Solidesulfovibrio sp.]MEA4857950.1 AAA family ATPase [Solidesulfovibrio sp.]